MNYHTLAQQAQTDQASAALVQTATILGDYWRALLAAGVPEALACELVLQLQAVFLPSKATP